MLKSRLLVISVIILVFLGSFYSHKLRAPKRNYSDFHCFYVAGERMLKQESIYVLRDKEVAEFRYAPVFALLMSAFALTDIDKADTLWFILNFCLLIISFILLKKLVIPEELVFKSGLILYVLTILGLIRFILHNFDSGQSNILMMSSIIMGLYYISRKKEILGGAIFAFSIMVKYTPLIFIPYFILRRKIKLSFVIGACVLIYLILPSLLIGPKLNFLYARNLIPFLTNSTILDQMTILDPKNQSLLSMVYRFFTNCIAYFHAPPMPFQALRLTDTQINIIFIVSAIVIYAALLCGYKRNYITNHFYYNIDYALLLICTILFNLNAWMPTYILLSMPYFIIIYYLIKNKFKDKFVFILWVISYILNFITIQPILGKMLSYKLHFYSPFTISAIFTFLALLRLKIAKNREEVN